MDCCICGKADLSTDEDGGPECELSSGEWVCGPPCYNAAAAVWERDHKIARLTAELAEFQCSRPDGRRCDAERELDRLSAELAKAQAERDKFREIVNDFKSMSRTARMTNPAKREKRRSRQERAFAELMAERDALAKALRAIVGQGDRRDCTDLTLLAGCAQIARAALSRLAP
jgi:hypothetical protein